VVVTNKALTKRKNKMPGTNSKLVNWLLGLTATLLSALIIGSVGMLVKLDDRTAELVTVVRLTSKHLKEGYDKTMTQVNGNTTRLHSVENRVAKLEVQNDQDKVYNRKIDLLHDTVKIIEGKMEVDLLHDTVKIIEGKMEGE